jgi:hypothetical protein
MKGVELYGRVRYSVRIEGLSERAAARRFGIDPRTVFIESKGRYERLFKDTRPSQVAQFVERVPMVEGRLDRKATAR